GCGCRVGVPCLVCAEAQVAWLGALSLHDALPISGPGGRAGEVVRRKRTVMANGAEMPASEPRQGVYDAGVVGGGLVGSALAYGLRRELARVAVLDEGEEAYRGWRGDGGLVRVESKGR